MMKCGDLCFVNDTDVFMRKLSCSEKSSVFVPIGTLCVIVGKAFTPDDDYWRAYPIIANKGGQLIHGLIGVKNVTRVKHARI